MTDQVAVPRGQLVKIGTVAAANIVKRLGLAASAVDSVEHAIADEINAMSAHFTLAVADVQTQYEVELARIKSAWNYLEANRAIVILTLAIAFVGGLIAGLAL